MVKNMLRHCSVIGNIDITVPGAGALVPQYENSELASLFHTQVL